MRIRAEELLSCVVPALCYEFCSSTKRVKSGDLNTVDSLKADSEKKEIELLALPSNKAETDGLYECVSNTEKVNISYVIAAVNFVQERESFRLSFADCAFLETYFLQESSGSEDTATQYLADDGSRVHLCHSRNGFA